MILKSILPLIFVIGAVSCAKILSVSPSPAISHFQMLRPLLKALAERGHEVTVFSHFPLEKKIPNYRDIDLRKPEHIEDFQVEFSTHTIFQDMKDLFPWGTSHCDTFSSSEDVQNLLQTETKFDLIFLEAFVTDCYLGFVAKYKAPYIVFSAMSYPLWQSDWTYNPTEMNYLPDNLCRLASPMNFYDKLTNVGCHLLFRFLNWKDNVLPTPDIIRRHFGVSVDHMDELKSNVSLVLVNSFQGITGSRPLLPNVLEVGGIHLQPPKPLPQDIKKFLDEATDGVIIMSMGSVIKSHSLNNKTKEEILRVFSRLKERILWKWEVDFPNPPPNLKTIRWMPQADVLGHPNVKLFIAHGGIHGLFEAVNYGVPILGIPLFGDQQGNLKSLQHRGVARVIEFEDLNEKSLSSAISAMLNDKSYAINAKKLSQIFHDQPQTPLERALFWTEYVIRHKGAPHFQNTATRLSWFQYMMLDVLLAAIFLIFLFIFTLRCILKLIKNTLFK